MKAWFQKKLQGFKSNWQKHKVPYLFVMPAVIAMLLLHFSPLIQGIWMSFLRLDLFTLSRYLAAPWVGLSNYWSVLFNPDSPIRIGLPEAARNTLIYAIVVTIGTTALGMIVALMLNRNFKGRALVRTLFLFSWIVPSFVVGILWGFMWQRDNGIINILLWDVFHINTWLGWLGVPAQKPFWLLGPNTLAAIIIPTIWRGWPVSMLLLLAGLQNISQDYYEAADIDGANGWHKFWHITFPLLRPVWAIILLFGMIFNVYSFNIVVMMFGNGAGHPGEWGDLLMTNIFRNAFQRWDFGSGAAVSVVMMLIMMGCVAIWYRYYRKIEEEMGN
jgi:multiple sugar transport system permease protein